MKQKNKIVVILLSMCLILPMFSMISYAASGSVSVSSKSGNVGSIVTITCTIKCSSGPIGIADVVLEYNQANLEYVGGDKGNGGYSLNGGAGSVVYAGLTPDASTSTLSFTMKFKILKPGTHKVSVSSASARDLDEVQFSPSKGSGTITGKTPTTTTPSTPSKDDKPQNNKDTNSKLSSLQIYPGTLSPAFSADTTSYTVTVPADTTEVTISATPQSSKATVSVSGGKDLKLGANEAKVIVVAENGSSIAYNLTIMCGKEEKIPIDGVDNTIHEGFTDDQIPTGFSRTKVTYNDRQYEALTHASGNMQLMCLKTDEGFDFYIYNQETQEFSSFAQIKIADGKYVIPLPLSEEVEDFSDYKTTSLTLQGKAFEVWKLNDEFSVAYVMNQDGVETLYRYDSVDGTFQRHTDIDMKDTEPVDTQKTWFPSEYYAYALAGLVALVAILWITMVYFIASRKKRHEARKVKIQRKLEKRQRKEEKILEKQQRKEEKVLEKQRRKEEKMMRE